MNEAELTAKLVLGAVNHYGKDAAASVVNAFKRLTKSYTKTLETTYDRVSSIKTLINTDKAIPLFDNFVTMTLTSRNGPQDEQIDEVELISRIEQGGKFVVSALAGRGKSVLLKYMALSWYHSPRSSIPLFLELRQLNGKSSKDIVALIHAVYGEGTGESVSTLERSLTRGAFIIFLDGFDEVDYDSREAVEEQIISLARRFQNTTIVVSGRPDPKFQSWSSFTTFHIAPMKIEQVVQLITLLEYPEFAKKSL